MNCTDSEYLIFLCSLQEKLYLIEQTPVWQAFLMLAGAIGSLFMIGKSFIFLSNWNNQRRIPRKLLELEKDMLISSFQNEEILEAQKNYIVPYCSNIDPSNQDDLRITVGVKELIFDALWNEIESTAGQRHILVLADSGMGKLLSSLIC
jgi:hypothetical protein